MELEEIWDNAHEKEQIVPEVDNIIRRKSSALIDQFKRQIVIENYIGAAIFLIMLAYGFIKNDYLFTAFGVVPIAALIFGVFTQIQLNRLDYTAESSKFLNDSYRFMRYFTFSFLLITQITIGLLLFLITPEHSALNSSQFIVVITIESVIITYSLLFYFPIIKRLNKLRNNLDNCF